MKRLMLAAVLVVSSIATGGIGHAACSGAQASAGISDTFHAQFGTIKVDFRTIGAPLTVGQPPVTAVGACDDGTVGPARGVHVLITNVATGTTLCDRWTPDIGSYDPFGFGLGLGAGILQPQDGTHPCGASISWDALTYALGAALGTHDPTRVRFPAAEQDVYGTSAGVGVGAIATGRAWWTTGSIPSSTDEHTAYYVRGVGVANWAG